ncbi:MAG: AIR synthase-related protein [Halorientalis sp.]
MSDLGKIDAAVFERVIAPGLGADRADVALGPSHGVDFGVLSVGPDVLVAATDPLSILPELGLARAGRLALDIVLTDVAVSGIAPTHCTVSMTVPPAMPDDDLAAIWRGLGDHAAELGVAIVDVHVSRAAGVDSSWVGGVTAFGRGARADLVRPDGARPGDALVVSTGPAAEIAGLVSTLYPSRLDLDAETVAIAQERIEDIAGVRDARAAFEAGRVTAMHDATEGGIVGGLVEMAGGAGVRFDVDSTVMPIQEGVEPMCDALGVDPWQVTSCGSLLCTVAADDAESVVTAHKARGTPAAIVGTVRQGSGVYVDGERATAPETDPSWAAIEALTDE